MVDQLLINSLVVQVVRRALYMCVASKCQYRLAGHRDIWILLYAETVRYNTGLPDRFI